MKMNIYYAYKLLEKAKEENEKDKIYLMYLSDRPYLKNDKGFNSYLKEITKSSESVKVDTRAKDDIMQELLERK